MAIFRASCAEDIGKAIEAKRGAALLREVLQALNKTFWNEGRGLVCTTSLDIVWGNKKSFEADFARKYHESWEYKNKTKTSAGPLYHTSFSPIEFLNYETPKETDQLESRLRAYDEARTLEGDSGYIPLIKDLAEESSAIEFFALGLPLSAQKHSSTLNGLIKRHLRQNLGKKPSPSSITDMQNRIVRALKERYEPAHSRKTYEPILLVKATSQRFQF